MQEKRLQGSRSSTRFSAPSHPIRSLRNPQTGFQESYNYSDVIPQKGANRNKQFLQRSDQSVVLRMVADPVPDDAIFLHDCQSSVLKTDAG